MNKYRSMIVWQRSHDLVLCALAAETESLVRTAEEMEYLAASSTKRMLALLDEILALLFSLVRRVNLSKRT